MTEAEIADYLTLEFPRHAFPPDFAQLIHAKTEGSPLFMADLVRYLRDRGVIAKSGADFSLRSRRMDFSPSETESARTEVDDTSSQTEVRATWTLAQTLPDIERALPESVRGMIERKIAQLSEDDHKLLTCASVQGYEFDSAVVAQVLKLDADEVEERLEKLERVFAFVKLMSEAEFPNRTLTLKYRFVHVFYQNALYAGLRATRKATLSRDVALALEACYGARSASVANELALLWEAARDSARAADYFLQAAEHSSQVFAVQEAVDLARRGLAMIEKLPDDAERQAKELPLQIILANTLIATQGYAAPEVEQAYLRGRVLCRSLGEAVDALPVLGGVSLIFAVKGQLKASRELAEEFLEIAKRKRDPAELFGRQMLALFYFYTGDITQACQRYQECAQAYEPKRHRHLTWVYGDDVGMSSNAYLSWARWISGYPEQAWRDTEEALRLGQEVTQANSHAFSLHAKAFHYQCCRKRQEARLWAEKLIAFSEEYGLRYWSALGNLIRGWALVEQGLADEGIEESRAGIAVCKASGMELTQTIMLAILAESYVKAQRTEEGLQTLNQAFAVVAKTNEHVYEAELWRLKGELFLQTEADNRETEAEGFYLQAIVTAQHQKAKSLELRAATSLARLWQRQGKHEEARQMLAEIYGWFTEGFDTADLQEARALLEELQTQT
ncbi:MAG: hypothetical protein HOP19_21375 [Acidobacteria bacterium]|nr:hypothetical protein [Acidobacteriota bacterium]